MRGGRGEGMHGKGACVAGGHAWQGGVHGKGAWVVGGVRGKGGVHGRGDVWRGGACVAGEMATAADGSHPTGMHSCII